MASHPLEKLSTVFGVMNGKSLNTSLPYITTEIPVFVFFFSCPVFTLVNSIALMADTRKVC